MAEGQVLIKELLEATEVDDSAYLPIDDGELTKKISVENFNKSSNVTAKAYAEAAAASAQTASDTVANINQKVDQAQGYANAAQTQAGYASTYADNAQTFAGNAQGYANTASGHATNAGASASAASSAADAAADNALLAQSWAEGNTGAREGENTNNARYWANKAQSAAQITIDDHLDPLSTNPVENRVIYNALNDMHTGGSNIEITTTQTSLYGKDVTISDGTTTVTETFDLTGKALFEGVLMTGDLTIESTDGTQTARGSLTVPYFGNYEKAIAFWTATIAVSTTTTQFNGLTVSAKKNGVVMGTGTFNTDYGKNLLKNTATSQTVNGITFTVNADKSVTVNGTATAYAGFAIARHSDKDSFNYEGYIGKALILSGCPANGSISSYKLRYDRVVSDYSDDYGEGLLIVPDANYVNSWFIEIAISSGVTVNNLVFRPMLRKADITDPTYEPYHDPITSASITVPEAGTYNLEVTLDWKTYTSSPFSVTEETTYNETIDGFIAPISLTTPTSEFYGQSISVTRNGVAVPVSLAFDNTGTASFTALDEGTYLFTLTYGGEPYTASVVVSAETTYSAVIKMWTATINITTASSQMQSQDIDVYKGSAKVATIAFNASGQASYLAHESGTYHFVCTVDGYPFTSADVVASDETVYSTSITYFGATLNISTSSSDLYSQTITIKKGSTVVGTTAFSAQGSASYTVHETGTYTCECEGYSGSATVSAETTYSVTINAGLDLSAWISAGSTTEYPLNPSSYADFAALEADEAAVRQLMTVHASVDYLAQATAGDSLMEDIVNSDVCAKWINLSDYAYDVLSVSWTGKNLLPIVPNSTIDYVGIGSSSGLRLTYNVDSDGCITCSGLDTKDETSIATKYANSQVYRDLEPGNYILSLYIKTTATSNVPWFELLSSTNSLAVVTNTNTSKSFTLSAKTRVGLFLKVRNGSYGFMIRKAEITDPTYEPYFNAMDTADKYGYGEWGIIDSTTTPPTWGALGNVPIMTANNAPYGVASAYQVFDGNANTSASGTDFSYQSVNPICVKKFECSVSGGTLQGSNDGSTYTNISDPSNNTTYYMYHRVHFASSQTVHTLQFYGRELKPLVPTMTADDKPKGQASASSIFDESRYSAFKAFNGDVNTMWSSTEGTNDQWVEYDFVDTVKPCQYYIKPYITVSGSTAYSKTAQVAVQGYINNEWVNISEKTLVSNSTTTAGNTTPSEIRGNITNPAEINKIRANFGEKVGVQRDTIAIFQAYGMDYSEKEFAQGSTRKTIYDHGVAPSGAITGGTKNPDCLTLSAVGIATVTIDKGTRTYMGGKAGLHASGTNRLKCGSGYSAFTASNMPDSNGFDISSISGSVAVGIEQTASGTFDCTEIWIE